MKFAFRMTRSLSGSAMIALLFLAPACGGSNEGDRPEPRDSTGDGDGGDGDVQQPGGMGGTDGGDVSDAPPGYPAGPYGIFDPAVGDIIENLNFEGLLRLGDDEVVSSAEAIEPLTLDDVRNSGATYALIHTATVWCPSCRAAADDLALRGDELSNAGAYVIELVLEGGYDVLPTDLELSLWATNSDLTVSTVRPNDERTSVVFPSREYVYIVELSTMQVIWAKQALFTDPTITEDGIDALLELL